MVSKETNNSTVYGDQHCHKHPFSSRETVQLKSPIEQVVYQDSIDGGWVKFCRKYYSGEIAHKPPHYRETFIWLVVNANHKQGRSSGRTIGRGQKFTSYQEIQDALHWFVGARKERFKKHQIEAAMKWLRSQGMIQTEKTTRGIIVTITKYDFYQDGSSSKQVTKQATNPTNELRKNSTINKNEIIKEIKNNKDLERVDNDPDGYYIFISEINRITNKRFRGDRKSRSQFNARLKEDNSIEDLLKAAENCKNDPYHLKNPKYLTPEFITRSDKLASYLNTKPEVSSENSPGKLTQLIKTGLSVNEKLKSIQIDLS